MILQSMSQTVKLVVLTSITKLFVGSSFTLVMYHFISNNLIKS